MPQEPKPEIFTAVVFDPESEETAGYLIVDFELESLRATVEQEVRARIDEDLIEDEELELSWSDDSSSASYGVAGGNGKYPWANLYYALPSSAVRFSEYD